MPFSSLFLLSEAGHLHGDILQQPSHTWQQRPLPDGQRGEWKVWGDHQASPELRTARILICETLRVSATDNFSFLIHTAKSVAGGWSTLLGSCGAIQGE